ncbi:MAG: PAS domain S-box protein [Candidatus Omnitrophica bacterium]|nr:PAS domain S-box protein [Candidatus Omnitrophota bacterium]
MSEGIHKIHHFKSFSPGQSYEKITEIPKEISEQNHVVETYRMLEKAVEQSMDGIAVADLNGVIRFCNQAWADMHGYCISELLGKHLGIFHTEEQMQKDVIPFNEQVKKIGFHQGEVGHRRKDGSTFPTWMTTNVLKDEQGEAIGLLGIARDITERKQIQEVLQESEQQYRSTIDSLADAVHVVDKNLRFILFNPVLKKWNKDLGLETDIFGKEIFEVFPFLPDTVREEYQRVFETGKVLVTEEHTRVKDKDFITETRKIPIFEEREVIQVVTVIRDISERKRTEELIRESENKHRTLLKNIPQRIFYKDLNSVYVLCNDTYAKDLGITPEIIKGKTDYDFFPKELAEKYRADDRRIIRSGQSQEIEEKCLFNGKEIIVNTFKAPIKDANGNIVGIFGIFWDITERKQAEEDLRRSEGKYKFLFEKSSVFSLIISMDQTIKDINTVSAENLGYSKNEVIGKAVLDFVIPEDRKKAVEVLKKSFKGEDTLAVELNVYAKNKSIHTLLFSPGQQVIFSEQGQPTGILVTAVDITERKKAERQQNYMTTGLRAVLGAADEFIACQDAETVFRRAVEFAREKFGLERCAIFIEEDNYVRGIYGTDRFGRTTDERGQRFEKNEAWKKRLKKLDPRDPNWVVVREPQLEWDGKNSVQIGEGWIVITPIQSAHRPIGVFVNDAAISGATLDPMKQDTLAVFCSLIGNIIERKRAENKLEVLNKRLLTTSKRFRQLSLRDSHTGLYNHRYLEEAIDSEFNRAKRYGYALSVIMMDLDYFKSINDVYGHQFGDLVLKQFSRQLRKVVRQYDTLIRFGGEEFVIISPGIDKATALTLSQRILESINLGNFGNEEHSVKLKLSVAVSSYPEDKITKGMDLINLVDKILSKVKEDGGDRVYSFADTQKVSLDSSESRGFSNDIGFLQDKIEKLTKRANQSLMESIYAFAKTIKLKDQYTGEHVESTVYFATEVARKLGLPNKKIEDIRQAAKLHDLGKIGISDRILLKRSRLTKSEFEEIKKHTQIGADILRPLHFFHDIIPMILHHHERWDGEGYPHGLKQEEIPLGARIVAVADVYQALLSDRPYRPAFSKTNAIRLIKQGAGSQFDPKIVDTFLSLV